MATVRYMAQDVDASIKFYVESLGFSLVDQYGPAMAIIRKDDMTLWLAGPMSSAAKAWNRIVMQVENLNEIVGKLRFAGIRFRNEIVSGLGGSQILCADPSGNIIELFQPA